MRITKIKSSTITDYQGLHRWYDRPTRDDQFRNERFLLRVQLVWRQLLMDFHNPDYPRDQQIYIQGIIKDVLTNPRVSESIDSPSVQEFLFYLLDWLEKNAGTTATAEMFESSLILLSCNLSCYYHAFESGDFCERLHKLIERTCAFQKPSLNRALLPLLKFLFARNKIVLSSFSDINESHESRHHFRRVDEGLKIAWKFDLFDKKTNASFMWDEDITTRINARAVLSFIGDNAGGQKAVIETIRQVHKLPNPEFISRVEAQFKECESEGFQIWITITRLLRDGFLDIMPNEMCRWLRIPWAYLSDDRYSRETSPTVTSRSTSPHRQNPKRTPSPKPPSTPKRKYAPDEEAQNDCPRPIKTTATVESKTLIQEPKSVKLNSLGFGAKITSSSWTIPAPEPSSNSPANKTFGFSAAASGVSPFSAVAQSSAPWSGWDTQKPATFEKKSLFSSTSKSATPSKNEESNKKKDEEEDSDGDLSGNENEDEESSDENLETQLENGDENEKPKKIIDVREQAGEAHEETLIETTGTLYEMDPKTAGWISKGTGIIHVNMDKDSDDHSSRNSRLIMRQKGTMKVMWNIRLFKGMQLLPHQISNGDRRMDIYVKMVLIDIGHPKSYVIKLRNHIIMDQFYAAIKRAIPS